MENITNSSINSFYVLDQISYIIGYYVITVICAIGVITNYCFLRVLSSKNLKHKFYSNMWIKTFCDLVVCLIGAGYLNNACNECLKKMTYNELFYNLFIIKLPLRIALNASTYAEIYLIFNRCISLFKIKSRLLYLNKWLAIIIIHFIIILINLPFFFIFEIQKSGDGFLIAPTGLAFNSPFSTLQKFFTDFIGFILPIILLVILNLISVIKFRRVVSKLNDLRTYYTPDEEKLERRFSKTIIILSCFFVLCKSIDYITIVLSKPSIPPASSTSSNISSTTPFIPPLPPPPSRSLEEESILNLSRQIAFLLNLGFHVLNSFFYVNMDSNLRRRVFPDITFSLKRPKESN